MSGKAANYHFELQSRVNRLEHDFTNHHGRLRLPAGEAPTMNAVINLFLSVDPELLEVIVFSSGIATSFYRRRDRRDEFGAPMWKAVDMVAAERV